MRGDTILVLSITANPQREMYGCGLFRVTLTDNVRLATNYRWYGPLKYLAKYNMGKSLPEWMKKTIHFKKILSLSGIMSGWLF